MMDQLKSSDCSRYINQKFRIRAEPMETVDVILIEVTELGSKGDDESSVRRPFSLIFRGPIDPFLSQGTYEIGHDQFGVFDIFIVPIGPDKERMLYQAIFA